MKNPLSKSYRVIYYILFIVLGYLIARYVEIPYFEVSKTIDITNIFGLLVTIFIAIIITTVFEKRNNDYRVEKDLIINRVDKLYEITDSFQKQLNKGQIHLTNASSSLKRITTGLNSIYKLINKCRFRITDDIKDTLKRNLNDIRKTSTYTPQTNKTNLRNSIDLPIKIVDSIIYYNEDRKSQLEVKLDSLKDLLLELQIDINKK